jgi:hypothetical protein
MADRHNRGHVAEARRDRNVSPEYTGITNHEQEAKEILWGKIIDIQIEFFYIYAVRKQCLKE